MSRPRPEKGAPRFLRESDLSDSERTVTAGDLLGRLERQAGELAVLRERCSSTAAALERERTARRGVEEELVRAQEEIEALRMEVDHAWTRLQLLRQSQPQQSRWRRRRGQATD
jgi:chromosome segregation ATPase